MPSAQEIITYLFSALAISAVASAVWTKRHQLDFPISIWKMIRPRMVVECLVVLPISVTATVLLMEAVPAFTWGWSSLFFKRGVNLHLAPTQVALDSHNRVAMTAAILFLIALLAVTPFWAKAEEDAFRKGYLEWKSILCQSIKFGLLHLIVGIPVGNVLALSMIGFFYGYTYRRAYIALIKAGAKDHVWPRRMWAQEQAVLVSTSYHTLSNSLAILGFIICFIALILHP